MISLWQNKVAGFFPRLFEPAYIGSLRLKNRLIMAPMQTGMAGVNGEVTQQLIDYFAERASGGVGMVITGHANVDYARGTSPPVMLRVDHDCFIPGLRNLVEAIQRGGARACCQINHLGAMAQPTGIKEPYAPSSLAHIPHAKELSLEEIAEIEGKFAKAAARAKRCGFDAIEIHGAHAYLIAQFLSPFTNRRNDAYGGDLDGRMRFALVVVEKVRAAVGADFPLIIRFNGDDFTPQGLSLNESKKVAKAMEQAGVNAVHVSAGGPALDQIRSNANLLEPMPYKQAWRVYLAEAIKKEVSIPVITVGVIREPQVAQTILEQGKADFIALGRALIADPDWPVKAREGRVEGIYPCIGCNEGCRGNRARGWPINCTVNARAGREGILAKHPKKALESKKVIIVGAGPAGMECARVAASRGHQVTVYEKEKSLGGQLLLASKPPGKEKIKWELTFLKMELERTGIKVKRGQFATADEVLSAHPDVVVVATGAEPVLPKQLNWDGKLVLSFHQVLSNDLTFEGKKVIVLGGGSTGCETAMYLAHRGNYVTVVEMLPQLASDLEPVTRGQLLGDMDRLNIRVKLETRVEGLTATGVKTVTKDSGEKIIEADRAIMALGVRPQRKLASELEGRVCELYVVGDANSIGNAMDAIYHGNLLGRKI